MTGQTIRDEELAREHFGAAADTTHLAGRDVIDDGARVRLVYHDPEDGWWFSSGGDDEDEELGVLCLACLISQDPSVLGVAPLPLNWIARRGDGQEWVREPRPVDWGPWEAAR